MEIQLLLKAGLWCGHRERLLVTSDRVVQNTNRRPTSLSSAAWKLFYSPRITALEDTLGLV